MKIIKKAKDLAKQRKGYAVVTLDGEMAQVPIKSMSYDTYSKIEKRCKVPQPKVKFLGGKQVELTNDPEYKAEVDKVGELKQNLFLLEFLDLEFESDKEEEMIEELGMFPLGVRIEIINSGFEISGLNADKQIGDAEKN